jgi:hypothetical protein
MGKILYPRVYMGNPMGRIFFDGYGYGMVLPTGMYPLPSLHHTVAKKLEYKEFKTIDHLLNLK